MLEVSIYVLGGLALFFLGLYMAEQGLRAGAGKRLENILRLFTSNIFSGILTGMIITAIIQSSSAVTVMALGFISGGVMTLRQGMGVVIGSNIGTTMTIHILSLKINHLEWILCILGILIIFWGLHKKDRKLKLGGMVCLGFGLIFFGLTVLRISVTSLESHPTVIKWLTEFGRKPLWGIITGLAFTAIIQSSSATSGLVLTLATQGMLSLKGAISIILGSNIGTCITALLAGIRVNQIARRLAYFHIIFNCLGVLFFIPMLEGFTALINMMIFDIGRQIALAHTLFNLNTAIIILPFVRFIERFLSRDY